MPGRVCYIVVFCCGLEVSHSVVEKTTGMRFLYHTTPLTFCCEDCRKRPWPGALVFRTLGLNAFLCLCSDNMTPVVVISHGFGVRSPWQFPMTSFCNFMFRIAFLRQWNTKSKHAKLSTTTLHSQSWRLLEMASGKLSEDGCVNVVNRALRELTKQFDFGYCFDVERPLHQKNSRIVIWFFDLFEAPTPQTK